MDSALHAAFSDAGGADQGQYTVPVSGAQVSCSVYVDRSLQDVGEAGQLKATRTEVTYVLASMAPVLPAERGRLAVDGELYVHVHEISNDGSLSRWLVRHG
jgi:hypothetical protein